MTEKQKPAPKAPSTWRGAKGMEHHGEMQPVKYGDSASKSFGNWLMGLLTPWKQ